MKWGQGCLNTHFTNTSRIFNNASGKWPKLRLGHFPPSHFVLAPPRTKGKFLGPRVNYPKKSESLKAADTQTDRQTN